MAVVTGHVVFLLLPSHAHSSLPSLFLLGFLAWHGSHPLFYHPKPFFSDSSIICLSLIPFPRPCSLWQASSSLGLKVCLWGLSLRFSHTHLHFHTMGFSSAFSRNTLGFSATIMATISQLFNVPQRSLGRSVLSPLYAQYMWHSS